MLINWGIVFSPGTTVLASNLFKNLPVRKQYYNTSKKKKDELKKVEDLVTSYGVIRHDVRFTLRHNKELLWQVWQMWFCISLCQKSKCSKMCFGIKWSIGTETTEGMNSPMHWVRPVMILGYLSSPPSPPQSKPLWIYSWLWTMIGIFKFHCSDCDIARLSTKDCLKF